jgi:hypothetical protein
VSFEDESKLIRGCVAYLEVNIANLKSGSASLKALQQRMGVT